MDRLKPEAVQLEKWGQEIKAIDSEPMSKEGIVTQPDPMRLKRDVFSLQKEIRGSEVNRFGEISPEVLSYFSKYHNVVIKDGYLRCLSSQMSEDHNRALVDFWSEVSAMPEVSPLLEEAVLAYYNYFLEDHSAALPANAIKTLILFGKKHHQLEVRNADIYAAYLRLLANTVLCLHQGES